MQKTLYFLYLIPEHDKRGGYFYTGMSKQPVERERQHDAKRYFKRCHFCHGEGKRWEFMVFKDEWVRNECILCHGYGKIKGNRKKRDRMHVVPYFGYRANPNENVFGDFCLETLSEALTHEIGLKKISRNFKEEIYRAGLLPEEILKRIEEITDTNGNLPEDWRRIQIYKDWMKRT